MTAPMPSGQNRPEQNGPERNGPEHDRPDTDRPAPAMPPGRPPPHRVWLVLLLPAGFLLGLLGGFLQEHRLTIGSVAVPWATLLVVATLVVVVRALSLSFETRASGAMFFAGWLIASALMALPNPSGDVVFTADIGSLGYLMAGCVLGAAAAAWPLFLHLPDEVTAGG